MDEGHKSCLLFWLFAKHGHEPWADTSAPFTQRQIFQRGHNPVWDTCPLPAFVPHLPCCPWGAAGTCSPCAPGEEGSQTSTGVVRVKKEATHRQLCPYPALMVCPEQPSPLQVSPAPQAVPQGANTGTDRAETKRAACGKEPSPSTCSPDSPRQWSTESRGV